MRSFARTVSALASAALLLCAATPASAQPEASGTDATLQSAVASQPTTKAEQKRQAKAQRKAERKAARAKNAAELKQLESKGYNPAVNDQNYPENLQNAQKKAAGSAGASQ